MSVLYIIATPIGNLDDITIRAIEVIESVDYVVCEDSRRTGILLQKIQDTRNHRQDEIPQKWRDNNQTNLKSKILNLKSRLITIHEHSQDSKINWLIDELKNGKFAALVTDAGTPGIADPGGRVVEKAIEAGIRVVPIPGPSSLAAILSITGWQNEPILFLGYLPKKKGRQTLLRAISNNQVITAKAGSRNYGGTITKQTQNSKFQKRRDLLGSGGRLSRGGGAVYQTVVFFESPNRINKTLKELIGYSSEDCPVVIGRELTKQFETIYRGTVADLANKELPVKGEYVVAIKMS